MNCKPNAVGSWSNNGYTCLLTYLWSKLWTLCFNRPVFFELQWFCETMWNIFRRLKRKLKQQTSCLQSAEWINVWQMDESVGTDAFDESCVMYGSKTYLEGLVLHLDYSNKACLINCVLDLCILKQCVTCREDA